MLYIFVIVCGHFEWELFCVWFHWFVYNCIVVWYSILKRRGLGNLPYRVVGPWRELQGPTTMYGRLGVGMPLTGIVQQHLLCLSQAITYISIGICRCIFCNQWFEMRTNSPSYCYWWNCWPALFIIIYTSFA
jgi:hypothetical protein